MKPTLQAGITRTETIRIDEARAIAFLGEEMRIYSTPSMVRDVEYTSLTLIDEHVDEGESSVGIHVAMDHMGATPLGEEVQVQITVTEVDGRKVTLEAEVRDALEVVGQGRHVRFVIDVAKHAQRLEEKVAQLKGS